MNTELLNKIKDLVDDEANYAVKDCNGNYQEIFYYEDKFANLPDLQMIWPTVEQYHPDMWALDMLGQILSSGKKAPFYKVIVEEKKLAK